MINWNLKINRFILVLWVGHPSVPFIAFNSVAAIYPTSGLKVCQCVLGWPGDNFVSAFHSRSRPL